VEQLTFGLGACSSEWLAFFFFISSTSHVRLYRTPGVH